MKMKLFLVTIEMADDRHPITIVAPDAERMMEFIRKHLAEVGGTFVELSVLRIDNTLSGDARLGLDHLLETAPVGLASFAEGLGWIAHVAPIHRLKLYRIETPDGSLMHVVAPNTHLAAAIWAAQLGQPLEDPVLYRITDGLNDLGDEQRSAMERFLEFGTVGIPVWSDGEWTVGD